jgi:succinylarginine dihydrolase
LTAREFNFDGLIGPTHNYAGLSYGNVASASHQFQPSRPRAAALQGLEKMKFLADLGLGQCVLPPLRRPRFEFLKQLGFSGTDPQLIDKAYRHDPVLLATCYSASNMWTANAATVSPAADCDDGKLHLTPANLSSTLHRSIEYPSTTRNLRAIFRDTDHFALHPPLPSQPALADEGAANHTRLCVEHGGPGIELFVYGSDNMNQFASAPKKFPARQTLLAGQSIARLHSIKPTRTQFIQQNPLAIDAGVFHNDVISVGNQNVLLCHELAFVDQQQQTESIRKLFEQEFGSPFYLIQFPNSEIGLEDTVASYLFNSQLVTRPGGDMTLICPIECRENEAAHRCTERVLSEENPIDEVAFLDLRQSMNNGGGPACLRLRVVLTEAQQSAIHPGVVLTDVCYEKLVDWVNTNYREQLVPDDLRDPKLIDESLTAMERLAKILELPASTLLDE